MIIVGRIRDMRRQVVDVALVDMDQSEAGQRDDAAQGLLLTGKATSELSVGPPHGFFRPTEKGNSDALSGASAIEKNSSSGGGYHY